MGYRYGYTKHGRPTAGLASSQLGGNQCGCVNGGGFRFEDSYHRGWDRDTFRIPAPGPGCFVQLMLTNYRRPGPIPASGHWRFTLKGSNPPVLGISRE